LEQIRIIGIYLPQCQNRKLDELKPFIVERIILTGDFNVSAQEWISPTTDARESQLKKWIDRNNLLFVPGTKNSSKRSVRHIDLIFTDLTDAKAETVLTGSSDHWPLVMRNDRIGFQTSEKFSTVNWTAFKIVLDYRRSFG
jgi:endonuclease/exonuclease/phosphatase (EEP) superfamily protein YafD